MASTTIFISLFFEINDKAAENFKITRATLYAADEDKSFYDETLSCVVNLISKKDITENSCGVIDESMFSCNIGSFTEAQKFNSCLNKKLSVDRNGNFKNCPSMGVKYGNTKQIKVSDVLNDNKYVQYGKINKDQIKICQGCEFRYICSDCRAFIMDPDDVYSKPAKCNYDPSLAEWK